MRYFETCGVRVASDVPLSCSEALTEHFVPDVRVRWAERRRVPGYLPDGADVLAHCVLPHGYALFRDDAGYVVRFFGTCDFRIATDLGTIDVHLAPEAPEEVAEILLAGNVLTLLLSMRGEHVLHASAVAMRGKTIAFVGGSGMGKSTLAARMCVAGGRLVTDDVLRVRVHDDHVECFAGSTELRLRADVGRDFHLPGQFTRRTTCDGRWAVTPSLHTSRPDPLFAILIPMFRAGLTAPRCERLSSHGAFIALARYPRILGWRDPRIRQQQFEALGALVERVPVLVAEIPEGAAGSVTLAHDLCTAVWR